MKLVNFLKKLRNEQVTIELKNGTTVWGTLQTVSPQMNATLTDVKLSLPRSVSNSSTLASIHLSEGTPIPNETSTSLQYINIRGSTIRQIILPDSLNIDSLLVDERELNRLRRAGKVSNDPSKKRRGEFGENSNKRIRRGV
ncbi:SMD1 (YGR074W) [Zygosaccharomyces parabailii]|nr:SMD1 (YGR074W) [Zygosaccharomyces parabailii]CDH15345.1 probable Small nuclear ribonucleoprotein Sm D1 [Zygosaccharomyces bailii ISA1307]SJM87809.1 probable Small nuclear ribonucleoprotein Sm D1 [Zygosaccharomyces bailii]